MVKIRWSPKAVGEFSRICEHIAKNSEYYAYLLAKNIFKRIEQLKLFRYSGRVVPEYNQKNLRELIYQNYRIVYRIKKDVIEIIWITHGAHLLPKNSDYLSL